MWRLTGFLVVLLTAVLSASCSSSGPGSQESSGPQPVQNQPAATQNMPRPMPPFHESAEAAKPFPKLLLASSFRDYPIVARAYRIASQIPEVIAQQPCYCYCDKFGHRSLLDCYTSEHGAG